MAVCGKHNGLIVAYRVMYFHQATGLLYFGVSEYGEGRARRQGFPLVAKVTLH